MALYRFFRPASLVVFCLSCVAAYRYYKTLQGISQEVRRVTPDALVPIAIVAGVLFIVWNLYHDQPKQFGSAKSWKVDTMWVARDGKQLEEQFGVLQDMYPSHGFWEALRSDTIKTPVEGFTLADALLCQWNTAFHKHLDDIETLRRAHGWRHFRYSKPPIMVMAPGEKANWRKLLNQHSAELRKML